MIKLDNNMIDNIIGYVGGAVGACVGWIKVNILGMTIVTKTTEVIQQSQAFNDDFWFKLLEIIVFAAVGALTGFIMKDLYKQIKSKLEQLTNKIFKK